MGSPEIDVEARLRRALAEVAARVEPGRPIEGSGSVGARRPGRRARLAAIAASVVLVVVVAGVVVIGRAGEDEVAMLPDPSVPEVLLVEEDGGTAVTAQVVVGGGLRCLLVSAVDAAGKELEVKDRGDVACLPVTATDQVVAAVASVEQADLTVVTGLAGSDHRSLGAKLSASSGPNLFDQLEGPVPAILVVLANPPGSGVVFEGELVAQGPGGPSDPVPFRSPTEEDAPPCLAAGTAEVCIDGDARITASGLLPGSEFYVRSVLALDGQSTAPTIVNDDGGLDGTLGFLSMGGPSSGFAVEVVATTADGATLAGTIAVP
jgi:hypothetical protein